MQIERTTDAGFVRAVLTDPAVWPLVSDDFSGAREALDPAPFVSSPAFHFLVPVQHGQRIGVFCFYPENGVTCEMHSAILPEYRGAGCWAARSAISWMFQNTRTLKITTKVPTTDGRLFVLTLAAGFDLEGLSRGSLLRDGRLLDQHLFGIGKEQ